MAQMNCVEDELGFIPYWEPPARDDSPDWVVTSHYFASYVVWRPPRDQEHAAQSSLDIKTAPTKLVAVVNRYVPRASSLRSPEMGGVTLVLAHWLGGHKEIWEPTINSLLRLDRASASSRLISEIWSFEPLHHGDAARLNQDGMPEADPMHYPFDLAEFIQKRMPEKWEPNQTVPTHLQRHETTCRPNVIGIGHSIGGTSLIHATLQAPKQISSLIVIEPFLVSPAKNLHKAYSVVSKATARQPDTFNSREVLLKYLKKSQLSADWDPQVVDTFVKFGAYENDAGQVFLKTNKSVEAKLVMSRHMFESVWFCLPSLPTPVFFIYANHSWIMSDHSRAQTRVQPPYATSCDLDAGHAVVQEKPQLLAEHIFDFLSKQYTSGREQSGRAKL